MATNPIPQNIACFETLALNILKISSPEKIASDINIPELDPCWLYNQKLFLYEIKKPITLFICCHLYHHNCIKSSIKINSTCPRPDCNKEIESIVVSMLGSQDIDLMEMSSMIFKSPMFTQSDILNKRTNDPKLFSDKPSNKKVKKLVKKESDILEDLIKELSTKPETQVPDVITNYYLFGKALSEQLEHYKKSNSLYASLLLVNKENNKILVLEKKFAEVEAENARLKPIIEENASRDAENAELKSRVRELEARLALLEQDSAVRKELAMRLGRRIGKRNYCMNYLPSNFLGKSDQHDNFSRIDFLTKTYRLTCWENKYQNSIQIVTVKA
ncbi:33404_t:CDS:2 [Gigaspora margarita]|uniref:33404_t:CDS:1 n=1 Tax=Gigaspora margarita TaxID=4874 RepID=A0ABM8VZC4_GIGMA|nr:33404_t:CDS:2 [Gigaspora margarita]